MVHFHNNFSMITCPLLSLATLTSLVASLVLLFIVLRWSKTKHSPEPPQPAGSRPIFGHLHLLGPNDVLHKVLEKLAEKNGPIFMLKLGTQRAVVITSGELTKECLFTHDKIFSNRPTTVGFKIFGYNDAMYLMSPYGPYWREMRKISATQLLSIPRLLELKHIRIDGLRASIREMYQLWDENKEASNKMKVDISKWFADLTLNSMLNMIGAGKALTEVNGRDRCHKAFRSFFEQVAVFTVGDALPLLKWFDIGGHVKDMKRAAAEIDGITQEWLDEHRKDRADTGLKKKMKRDFIDLLLDILETGEDSGRFFGYDIDTVIKATCQVIVLAGADTISWTSIWAISLLLNHPHILKMAKDELDTHIGRSRTINDSDLNNLTYLHAIIKETMRLYPGGPLGIRSPSTDVVINGYHIAAGTQVYFNVHKIHRDPLIWSNPDEFIPDRFLGDNIFDMDITGKSFEFYPFGSGRRVCPGATFALQSMPFILANFLHSFDISRLSEELIDLTEGPGITNAKAKSVEILLAPSLPRHLYQG